MLDVAKLRLPSFDTDSDSLISDRQWTYTRPDGPSTEVSNISYISMSQRSNSGSQIFNEIVVQILA